MGTPHNTLFVLHSDGIFADDFQLLQSIGMLWVGDIPDMLHHEDGSRVVSKHASAYTFLESFSGPLSGDLDECTSREDGSITSKISRASIASLTSSPSSCLVLCRQKAGIECSVALRNVQINLSQPIVQAMYRALTALLVVSLRSKTSGLGLLNSMWDGGYILHSCKSTRVIKDLWPVCPVSGFHSAELDSK